MTKSLSIVIPVFNEEDFLQSCLQSIARQSVAPDEVIVVDNNSTDRSAEVAKSFPFVTLVQEPNQGIVHARNTGFDAASSDIIGRIDADTILPANWVARVRRFYNSDRNDNKALSGGGYFYNLRWKRFNGWMQSQLAYRLNRFVVGHYVLWGSNMAITRRQWLDVRDVVCLRDDIHEDLDLSFHLHDKGVAIVYHGRLKVGVYLKRFFNNRHLIHSHMNRWPQSLKTHGYKMWWLGTVGNWFLWYLMQPLTFVVEYTARMFGSPPRG